MKMIYDYGERTEGVIVCEMDYSERYQPIPMREIQSENFGKDEDVSMKICIVTYNAKFDGPTSGLSRHVISYGHLSDEKPQIAATTFINSEQMFRDIYQRQELSDRDYNTFVMITDGCAGQYKCEMALYMLAMQAQGTGKYYSMLSNVLVMESVVVMLRAVATKLSAINILIST
jgi:hypothetical protein